MQILMQGRVGRCALESTDKNQCPPPSAGTSIPEGNHMTQSLMTPEEAITFLGLDRQKLQQPREALRWLCRTGQLRYTKVGRYVRFRRQWLEELVERNEMPPKS